MMKKRLSKYLAEAGIASRRACEAMIFAGRIKVNGRTTIVQVLVGHEDEIEVDGQLIEKAPEKVYYILNKPKGVICSHEQRYYPKRVVDLFGPDASRLFTVGRLDKDTSGLLLVTNDGHFAQRVIHPSANIQKEYIAKVNREINAEHLKIIAEGTWVEGVMVKPIKVVKMRRGTVKVVVGEGKKREVRHLIENADLKVLELKRTRVGGLHLGILEVGAFRSLTANDMESIFNKGMES
jgi:23S rRNA pseudouridine2605 synthase